MPERTLAERRSAQERFAASTRREENRPRPEGRPPSSGWFRDVPFGVALPFWFSAELVPENFALCDGSTVSDPLSPLDGQTLPDLRGVGWVGLNDITPADPDFNTLGAIVGSRSIEIDDHEDHAHTVAPGDPVLDATTGSDDALVGDPVTGEWVSSGAKTTDGTAPKTLEHAGRLGVTGSSPTEGTHDSGRLTVKIIQPSYVGNWITRIR